MKNGLLYQCYFGRNSIVAGAPLKHKIWEPELQTKITKSHKEEKTMSLVIKESVIMTNIKNTS